MSSEGRERSSVVLRVAAGTQKMVPTGDWHLPPTSTMIESWVTITAEPQHPLKELRLKVSSEALCALGKLAEQVFTYIQEKILWVFSHRLISRKALKPFIDDVCSLWLAAAFCKMCAWFDHQNHKYTDIPLPLWSSFSELSEMSPPGL